MPQHGSTSTPTSARAWLDAHAAKAGPAHAGRQASSMIPKMPQLTEEGRRRADEWVSRRMAEEMEAVAEHARRRRVSMAKIPERYREPRQRQLARELLGQMQGDGCLYIWGDVGRGKTDLACSVALEWIDRSATSTALFTSDVDMVDEILSAIGDRGDTVKLATERFVRPGLLVIDDLGKLSLKGLAIEKLWAVVDGRYRAARPTVFTSQLDRKGLRALLSGVSEGTANPMMSRMYDKAVVRHLEGPDRRLHG